MGEKLTLNLFYEGEEYKEGEIDIKQFAPSLLAFADVIEEVNNILNDNKRLKTKINANFEKKCFKIEMKIDAMDLIKSITNQFLKLKEQYSIENILEIAGFIVIQHPIATTEIIFVTGYIMYRTLTKGKKIKSETILENGNKEIITQDLETKEETIFHISVKLGKLINVLYKNKKSKKKINNAIDTQAKIKGDLLCKTENNNEGAITQDMKNILNNSIETDNNISEPDIIRCLIEIRRPDWKGSKKWEFIYIGETIIPEYSDIIEQRLLSLKTEIIYNTKLDVSLKIQYETDLEGNKIKDSEKYFIEEIFGIKQIDKQETLFN